ncbi:MAG TPA: STAS domain-containing protein [Pseudobacteroides sp.]|jgi:anti-anti-sigma factor|nr:STAS domain-containing protein [Bacillota bacterium]HOV25522.1 STAS domain-containing protein [Pseudobacteroides sp.]
MKVEVKELNNVKVVKLIGQVRISTQNEFKDLLDNLVKESAGQIVIVNMEGIIYMNSIGLGIIIDTYKKFKEMNGRMVLCNLLPEIMNLFEVTRLNRFIEIYGNESEALKKVTA